MKPIDGLKHLALSKPSVASNAAFRREYDHFDQKQIIKVTIYIGENVYSYDHLDFVNRCRVIWLEYLRHVSLIT